MGGKWLELLRQIAPGVKRAAIMFNPDTAPDGGSYYLPSFEAAARAYKMEPIVAHVHSDAEIEMVMTSLSREPRGGIVVSPDAFMLVHREQIILLAARKHTGGLLQSCVCQRGRFAFLRTRVHGHHAALGILCRSHSPWRKTGRSTGSTAGQIRNGFEHQDRQSTRPYRPAIDLAARRRGDRVAGPLDGG